MQGKSKLGFVISAKIEDETGRSFDKFKDVPLEEFLNLIKLKFGDLKRKKRK